uniref:Fork-head domain-containing protein n=1 Tax=Taenia asiatica TaxID=60517 RepID=A0A0R3W7L4_TAEAS
LWMSDVSPNIATPCQSGSRMIALGYPQSLINNSSRMSNEVHGSNLLLSREQHASSDLLSLSWLQKGDIIKITPLDNEEEVARDERYSTVDMLENRQAYKIHEPINAFSNSVASTFSLSTNSTPMHPYFGPHYSNTCGENLAKPLYSYTHLIFMAIESTPTKCMTVNQIYNWCETNFPFFKHSATGWKNSLRHNLSINKSFKRLPRDGRGPGRGAFWAIEPRERPNLLDAVKRNPFTLGISRERSVVRPITINPIQPFSATNSDISKANFTEFAGECATKSNGASNLIISNRSLDGNGSFGMVDIGGNLMNKRAVAPYQTAPLENLQLNSSAQMTHSYLPLAISEAESPVSQEAVKSSAYAFGPWPVEEEEKYQEMMRLLLEGHNTEASCDPVFGDGTSIPNSNGTDTPAKPKKETKQRRKSSLNPTTENMCDRCKENAASTCRSCSLRMWNLHHTASTMPTISTPMDAARVLSHVNKPGTYGVNSALDELLDALDEDQEAPPPHWHKQVQPAGEVYITPAPYLDHEYCHCQKHIRPIAETCIIDAVNSRLRQEKLHLLRGLVGPRAGLTFDTDSVSMGPVEVDFVRPTKSFGGAKEGDYRDNSPPAYVRQTKRSARRIGGITGSRKRRAKDGGTYAPMPKVCKRPSVSNRALKRSYDELDIEDYAALGYADDNDFYIDNDYYDPPPYTGHYQRRIHFSSTNDEEFCGLDDEAEIHKRRFKRRFLCNPRVICATSSRVNKGRVGTPFSKSFSTTRKRRLAEPAESQHEQQCLKKTNAADETSEVADLLTNGTKDVKSGALPTYCHGIIQSYFSYLQSLRSEHSTAQAAKILMGISQVKNFKTQSDLVSMHSSQSSEDSLVASSVSI